MVTTIKNKVIHFFSRQQVILSLFILVTVIITVTNVMKGETKIFSGDHPYTFYNNYIIFKNAFFHLKSGEDMYVLYPEKQWDLYKYSPSFAACMSLIAWTPDWAGLLIWNLVNSLVLFFGVRYFIKGPPFTVFMLWFILNEMFTSLLNSQSNPLIAGLLVAGFTFFEKDKVHWAALCIVSTFYIKIFGILAALLFIFYPNKGKFIGWAVFWTILLGALPLLFTGPQMLITQYGNWLRMLSEDHSGSYGYSFMGVLHSWAGINSGKDVLVLIGLVFLVTPLLFVAQYRNQLYRIQWFAALLVWMVIFNHKAESPTFIIAFTGIALWAFSVPANPGVLILAVMAFVFTSLAPTDIFPVTWRRSFFEPYAIKVVPCILIWIYLTLKMLYTGWKKEK